MTKLSTWTYTSVITLILTFCSVHVPSVYMEEAGFMTYTAASHQFSFSFTFGGLSCRPPLYTAFSLCLEEEETMSLFIMYPYCVKYMFWSFTIRNDCKGQWGSSKYENSHSADFSTRNMLNYRKVSSFLPRMMSFGIALVSQPLPAGTSPTTEPSHSEKN